MATVKSLTPDFIPLSFIKKVAPIISSPLAFIFNLSLMRAEVPTRWTLSIITPIPKKPPYNLPSNFRPVSITSIFARLFEKILKKRIEDHLQKHAILSRNQHGFQKGSSTVTAMIQALNHWTKCIDEGKSVDVVYLDFSKAFDRVQHKLLLHKMDVVGIHPRIITWMKSFLSGRRYIVRVNSSFSSTRVVRSGVPQGGVLSPVLFNIYTHDLLHLLSGADVEFCAYADDLKIYRSITKDTDAQLSRMQSTVSKHGP